MKKKINLKKVIFLICIILSIVFFLNTSVLASTINTNVNISNTNTGAFKNIGERILGVVQIAGTFVSVIALILIGIKYLFGSVEERAEQKNALLYYMIGAVLVFATVNVVKIAHDIIANMATP